MTTVTAQVLYKSFGESHGKEQRLKTEEESLDLEATSENRHEGADCGRDNVGADCDSTSTSLLISLVASNIYLLAY